MAEAHAADPADTI